MYKRILAVFLALVISCTVTIKPMQAQAAEAGILGGALAGMGVTLSVPQIALLVAAAGGAVYLYENREAVAESLETFLDVAAQGLEEKKQQLQDWWNAAKLGHVAISTAQDWIKESVKEWMSGLVTGSNLPVSGDASGYDYWGNPIFKNGSEISHQTIYMGLSQDLYVRLTTNAIIYRFYRGYSESNGNITVTLGTFLYKPGSSSTSVSCDYTVTKASKKGCYQDENGNLYPGVFLYNTVTATTTEEKAILKSLLQGSASYWFSTSYSDPLALQQVYLACKNGTIGAEFPSETYYNPSAVVGGVSSVLASGYTMQDVYYDDLEFVGYGYITADTTKTGEEVFEESITNTLAGMQSGIITWEDYVTDVSTAPTITVPDTEDETITNDFVIGNTGITDTVVTPTVDPPELEDYKVQLRDFFPFCLPFDIADFIGCLAAEPEAPCFEFTLPWIDGEGFIFTVDLSAWDPVAEIVRTMELLALIVGLCFKTRDLIKG